jgi:hypothetical protein
MCVYGTRPDEISWPEVDDFQPSTQVAVADEADEDEAANV